MSLPELKDRLARANRILYYERTTSMGRGHQSYLLEEGRMMLPGHLHPYGKALGDVRAEDIVTVDFDGKVLEGKHPEPMGEFYIYSELFRTRKDVRSVIHVHPQYVAALYCAGKSILPVTRDSLQFVGQVAVFEKFPLYIGTREHGAAAALAMGDKKVLVHRGHGVVVAGRSIEDALFTALALERAARTQWMASVAGEPLLLPEEELTKMGRHVNRSDEALQENFLYYAERLKKLEAAGGVPYPY